jgi:hypothetical protein
MSQPINRLPLMPGKGAKQMLSEPVIAPCVSPTEINPRFALLAYSLRCRGNWLPAGW